MRLAVLQNDTGAKNPQKNAFGKMVNDISNLLIIVKRNAGKFKTSLIASFRLLNSFKQRQDSLGDQIGLP